MNFKFDLFIDIVWLSTICSIISSVFFKKIKEIKIFNGKNASYISSLIINFSIGFIIGRMFTNLSIKLCIFVGIITWLGAETIYEKLKKEINQVPNEELDLLSDDIEDNIENE